MVERLLSKNEWRYFIFSDGGDCRLAVVNRLWLGDDGIEYEVSPNSFRLGDLPNDVIGVADLQSLGICHDKVCGRSIYSLEMMPLPETNAGTAIA